MSPFSWNFFYQVCCINYLQIHDNKFTEKYIKNKQIKLE